MNKLNFRMLFLKLLYCFAIIIKDLIYICLSININKTKFQKCVLQIRVGQLMINDIGKVVTFTFRMSISTYFGMRKKIAG